MKKPEILAPAGNMLCLKAAILAGADAVYLGGRMFGARAFSNNFSDEEIIEAVNYAHIHGVKIYVTTNIIIYENEISNFMSYIDFLYNHNVDAIIMQDIGMMDLVRKTYPDFEIHASTQMHIHNIEGTKFVYNMGLKRAVLARETSIDDIKKIKKNVDIELEIFVHGALCISYSGQCLMSSLIGGRSGNRGTCAGSCRQKYDVLNEDKIQVNKEKYNLSTKDLNSLDNIGELIETGVDSLKIEGRMKSPEYVYLVVSLYRKAVDSYINTKTVNITQEEIKDLKKTFNRMFTKGFLFNEENNNFINPLRPNHQGIEIGEVIDVNKGQIEIKLKEQLNLNDGIRFTNNDEDSGLIVTSLVVSGKNVKSALSGEKVIIRFNGNVKRDSKVLKTTDYELNKRISNIILKNERKIKISAKLTVNCNNVMELQVNDGKNIVKEYGIVPIEKANNSPTTKEKVLEQLSKTGNTAYEIKNFEIIMTDEVFIPIKEINELRRRVLEKLDEKRLKIERKYKRCEYKREVPDFLRNFNNSIYIKTIEQYNFIKDKNFNQIYADKQIYNLLRNEKMILKLPRVIEKYEDYDCQLLVGELGSINKYKNIDTDFSLNVVNSYSVALLHSLGVKKITLSYEMDKDQIKNLILEYRRRYNKNPNLEMIVYGKEEIMISKFDLLKYYKIYSHGYLKDKFNNLYRIVYDNGLMYIYNYKAREIKDLKMYYDMGINSFRYNILEDEELKVIF